MGVGIELSLIFIIIIFIQKSIILPSTILEGEKNNFPWGVESRPLFNIIVSKA